MMTDENAEAEAAEIPWTKEGAMGRLLWILLKTGALDTVPSSKRTFLALVKASAGSEAGGMSVTTPAVPRPLTGRFCGILKLLSYSFPHVDNHVRL
jgi:hypothetical protein